MATKTQPTSKSTAKATPAAIAAHQTAYEPLMALTAIHPHPHNPRHNAVADAELVASIRDQGLIHDLVVAQHPEIAGEWILIDGHRRYDALTRNGYTFAPAKIRLDLVDEGDQLAAMLATIRREDLSPVEEAEGFEDLFTVHGWSVERIAAATGRSKTTVTERRRLVRLPEKTKTAADAGQITIDDALRIAKLPAADQTALEKVMSRGDFRYELSRTEERAAARKAVDAEAKKLRAAGVPEVTVPKTVINQFYLNHANHGVVRLPETGFPNESDHPGCLVFIIGGTKQYPALWHACSDPGKHDADLSQAQKERRAQETAEEAAREQRIEAEKETRRALDLASQMRCDALVAAVKTKPVDPVLEALLRYTLPDLIAEARDNGAVFQSVAGVPDEQRWNLYQQPPTDWVATIATLTGPALVKLFATLLATQLDSTAKDLASGAIDPAPHDHLAAAAYFDTLAAVGHEFNTLDNELRDTILGTGTSERAS